MILVISSNLNDSRSVLLLDGLNHSSVPSCLVQVSNTTFLWLCAMPVSDLLFCSHLPLLPLLPFTDLCHVWYLSIGNKKVVFDGVHSQHFLHSDGWRRSRHRLSSKASAKWECLTLNSAACIKSSGHTAQEGLLLGKLWLIAGMSLGQGASV